MRVVSYNLEFAKSATPAEIAELLAPRSPDIVCFCEVPGGEWTALVGERLGMPHSFVGNVASANHDVEYPDKTGRFHGKFKSLLSRTPLRSPVELELSGVGWAPSSVVLAETTVGVIEIAIGTLHIPTGVSDPSSSCAANLAELMEDYRDGNVVLCGDFNDLVDSGPMRSLYERGFENAWDSVAFDCRGAMTCDVRSGKNWGVIDHIISRGGLKAVEAGIIPERETPLSDHSAIFADFV